jgi:hypothetical protein
VHHENEMNRFGNGDPVTRSGPGPDAEECRGATPGEGTRDKPGPDEVRDEWLCSNCRDALDDVDAFFLDLLSHPIKWDVFSSLRSRLLVANSLWKAGWEPWIMPTGILLYPPPEPDLKAGRNRPRKSGVL